MTVKQLTAVLNKLCRQGHGDLQLTCEDGQGVFNTVRLVTQYGHEPPEGGLASKLEWVELLIS